MLSKEDALYGAAWKVLYEHLDPDGVTTTEKMAIAMEKSTVLSRWIEAQVSDVRFAYTRAKDDIMKRAKDILENNERHRQMIEVHALLPKPPAE